MPKLLITKNSPNNKKLQIINAQGFIRDSTYIRNTVLPILRSSITDFYEYGYDGGSYDISDGGGDMYDDGNYVYLNGVPQLYDTESANTFCYTSYPFIYKTTQTSNFTLSVQGNYGSDGAETKYQYQQDFDYQGRKFSIYISESTDLNDPSIVECFIVYYPNTKPTINFTYTESGDENGNETIDVSNLNGQSITAFYLLISTQPAYVIGSATLFDALKTFVVNATSVSTHNSIGKKLKIIYTAPAGIPVASTSQIYVNGELFTRQSSSSGPCGGVDIGCNSSKFFYANAAAYDDCYANQKLLLGPTCYATYYGGGNQVTVQGFWKIYQIDQECCDTGYTQYTLLDSSSGSNPDSLPITTWSSSTITSA